VSAIPAVADFLTTGDVDKLVPLKSINAIPAVADFLTTGNVDALAALESINAIPAVADFLTTGNVDALAALESINAIPAVADFLTTGDVNKLAALASVSAIPAVVDFLTGAPVASQASTTTASFNPLSSLKTIFSTLRARVTGQTSATGSNPLSSISSITLGKLPNPVTSIVHGILPGSGPRVLTTGDSAPGAGQQSPLAALAPKIAAKPALTQRVTSASDGGATSNNGSVVQALNAVVPKPQAQPAVDPEPTPQVQTKDVTPDNSGPANQNITRDSKKYTPRSTGGDSSILFGTGTPGADKGIRGWGAALKKLGIGGG
jgi:hypothetical protein